MDGRTAEDPSNESPAGCCLQQKLLDLPSELLCRILSFVPNKEKVEVRTRPPSAQSVAPR